MKLLLFTGHSCSGKTTVSKLIVDRENFHLISVHEYMKQIAEGLGYKKCREWFQTEGIENVTHTVSDFICEQLKHTKAEKVVIDDIFSVYMLNSIQKIDCKKVMVAMITKNDQRLNRMSYRKKTDLTEAKKELKLYDDFKNEVGIDYVIAKADFSILNESDTIENIYAKIINIVNNKLYEDI